MADNSINVVSSSGDVYSIPQEQLDAALRQNYRVARPDEVKLAIEQKKADTPLANSEAFALGAARGLTFGASDLALTGSELYTLEELRQKEELHPKASTAGELRAITAAMLVPAYCEAATAERLARAAEIAETPVKAGLS